MAELATIARPYAEALFQATRAQAPATAAWLETLAQVAQNEQLRQFAASPKSSDGQVYDLFAGAMDQLKQPLGGHSANFLRTVIENGRIEALPEIAQQYAVLKNTLIGAFDAVVNSAFEMDQNAMAELSVVLEKRFGRKLNLRQQLQPDLIGGVRVVVGDEVLDTSIKARLEQMKAALTA